MDPDPTVGTVPDLILGKRIRIRLYEKESGFDSRKKNPDPTLGKNKKR